MEVDSCKPIDKDTHTHTQHKTAAGNNQHDCTPATFQERQLFCPHVVVVVYAGQVSRLCVGDRTVSCSGRRNVSKTFGAACATRHDTVRYTRETKLLDSFDIILTYFWIILYMFG